MTVPDHLIAEANAAMDLREENARLCHEREVMLAALQHSGTTSKVNRAIDRATAVVGVAAVIASAVCGWGLDLTFAYMAFACLALKGAR